MTKQKVHELKLTGHIGQTIHPSLKCALESQQSNNFKQSRSVDKIKDMLAKGIDMDNNFLQAFSEEQKKLIQMENIKKCLQAQTEENGGMNFKCKTSFQQELPCLIGNLKIRSLVHDGGEPGEAQPNPKVSKDLQAHYKTQPSNELNRESKLFAKSSQKIYKAEDVSDRGNQDFQGT